MRSQSTPQLTSDQMLMASHILQALEFGGMPMHAAGYLELSTWACAELRGLDVDTLAALSIEAPPALRQLVANVLHERGGVGGPLAGVEGLIAHCAWRVLLRRLAPARG